MRCSLDCFEFMTLTENFPFEVLGREEEFGTVGEGQEDSPDEESVESLEQVRRRREYALRESLAEFAETKKAEMIANERELRCRR